MASSPEKPENRPTVDDTDHSDAENVPRETSASKDEEPQYPKGLAVALIMSAVWLSLFLVALVSSLYQHILD
jgi:hypothetical protein